MGYPVTDRVGRIQDEFLITDTAFCEIRGSNYYAGTGEKQHVRINDRSRRLS